MAAAPTRYFDRYARTLKVEAVYGERWLRLAYGNPIGRLAVWLLVRRAIFSRWYGWKMNWRSSALRVLPFIAQYNVDVDEFAKSAFDYKTFNEFFYRALKPESRPIAPGARVAVFPADGRHLAFPDVDAAAGFYAKGRKFTLAELLGEADRPEAERPLARQFAGGAMLISRLCPVDYHRFHFPVDGVPGETRRINGWLYSVHPIALLRNVGYLTQNKRDLTLIDSPEFGAVAMLEIGATNVGSIRQGFIPGRAARKGDEKGFFAFGGSCVITLFTRGRIRFDADLADQSAQGIETYARLGDRLGEVP
jgi:phosphatidylserine decarboxylase